MNTENAEITFYSTDKAKSPAGHYSQAVGFNGLVFVSGQLGYQLGTSDPAIGSIKEQTRNCLIHLEQILLAANSNLEKVVKVTIYISDVAFWPDVNSIYAKVFGGHRPARAIVPCAKLHYGFDVEIEAIAIQ